MPESFDPVEGLPITQAEVLRAGVAWIAMRMNDSHFAPGDPLVQLLAFLAEETPETVSAMLHELRAQGREVATRSQIIPPGYFD